MKSCQSSTSNTSEFVMSVDESALPNCLSTVILVGGIQKSLLVKNCGKVLNAEIQDKLSKEKRLQPPTPRDILEEKNINSSTNTLFKLIASFVSPNSTLDENGTAKLSKVKATKVSKLCDDIETLIATAKPSLSQVLLSLNIYRKTGSQIYTGLDTDCHILKLNLQWTNGPNGVRTNQNQSQIIQTKILLLHLQLIILTGKTRFLKKKNCTIPILF